jgi:serine/threonine protein kinase
VDTRFALPVNAIIDGSYRIVRVVGSGGFAITYAAEDINLGTTIALKEYYPFDFGDRDGTTTVRPKSDRHRQTFEWGRTSFLREARTLARFDHSSIVRVTRVFEANSTAYMVMRFEQGRSYEAWLKELGRPPTQEELDRITNPLLDALEIIHRGNILHRDIAPDNIVVRQDGTPVLLDFGAARRAVAEISQSLTGIFKPGYSPHEQYASDNRMQGPWSDLYALGGTLYRAVTGRAPQDAALRIDRDEMPPATRVANGRFRQSFLEAIDGCLKVRHSERPQSVAQLRSMLREAKPQPRREIEHARGTQSIQSSPFSTRWLAIAAALAVVFGVAYGGFEFMRWEPSGRSKDAAREADTRKETAVAIAQRLAELDAERERRNAPQRERETEADLRRREAASEAAEIERRRREDMERIEAGESAKQEAGTQCERALRLHLRGLQAIEVGDIYTARQFFKLGADAGLPQSAAALGATYDPAELAKLKVVGPAPDAKNADVWYEKARVLRATGPLRGCEKVEMRASPSSPDADLTEFRRAYTSGDGLAYVVIKDEKGERIFRYGDESRLAAKLGTRGYTLFTCNEPWTLSPQKEEDVTILLKARVVRRSDSQFADLDAKYLAMCNNPLVKSAIPKN